MSTINSDEHDAGHGVRSGREQPLAPEYHDKPGAYFVTTGQLRENKGESVSGAEWRRVPASRSAAETNSLDRYTANRTRWFLPLACPHTNKGGCPAISNIADVKSPLFGLNLTPKPGFFSFLPATARSRNDRPAKCW